MPRFIDHPLYSNLYFSDFENFRNSLKEINPALQFAISVNDPGKTLRTSGTIRQEVTARLIGILKEVIHTPNHNLFSFQFLYL